MVLHGILDLSLRNPVAESCVMLCDISSVSSDYSALGVVHYPKPQLWLQMTSLSGT